MTLLPNWWTRRLWRRFAAVSAGLLLLVQAAVFGLVERAVDPIVGRQIEQDLRTAEQAWQNLLDQRAAALTSKLALLAEDSGLIEAVQANDPATLADALANHGDRIQARYTALFDPVQALQPQGRPQVAVGAAATSPDLQPVIAALTAGLAEQRRSSGRAALDTLVASAPVLLDGVPGFIAVARQRDAKGSNVLVMGVPLGEELLQAWRATSPMDLALLTRAPGGEDRVALSTLQAGEQALLLGDATSPRLQLRGGEHVLRRGSPVLNASGRLQTVLMQSVAQVQQPFQTLLRSLLLASAAGVLLALWASRYSAHRVTLPLADLVKATRQLGDGDFKQPVAPPRHDDEVGELAQAIEAMRINIRTKTAEIEALAYTDRLTGLPNRMGLRDAARTAIDEAEAQGGGFSVLLLGLDRLKLINKNLGYAFGDQVLRAVATRLQRHVMRDRDLVARLSGDHFALLLHGADARRAQEVADGIAAAFVQPLLIDEQLVDVSARFGIACWPLHAGPHDAAQAGDGRAEALVARAEMAMHGAKGKTPPLLVYDAAIDAHSAQNLNLLSELRQAIAGNELRLFLQPKVDIATHTVIGAEALVRWQHPTRGMVPPMEFIPFAEDTGFVRRLTQWIFEETARQWPALRAAGLQRVSINLSTRDLLDPELPQLFDAILRRQGVPATAFCLEITESAVMDEPKRSLAMLDTLARAGFKLSIDDYGEGQTSLSYLKKLPVHELKIDQIFIKHIDRDEKDAKIVRSTIGLAHSLGFRVVAEGVETAEVLGLLRGLGCDEAQGWHLGRPMPAAEMAAHVRRWSAARESATA